MTTRRIGLVLSLALGAMPFMIWFALDDRVKLPGLLATILLPLILAVVGTSTATGRVVAASGLLCGQIAMWAMLAGDTPGDRRAFIMFDIAVMSHLFAVSVVIVDAVMKHHAKTRPERDSSLDASVGRSMTQRMLGRSAHGSP